MELTILGAAGAASKASAKRLQAALATLGKVVGSASLKAIKADGAIGPKTVAGVNWAFTHHIGPGQAPTNLRTGTLAPAFVKANVGMLTSYIEREVARRGAKAASPTTVAKASAVQAVQKAPTATPANLRASAKRLQAALVRLGKVVGSAQLRAIKVDGAVGAKTAAGVNWAFTHHIGPGQAPAALRTGNLSVAYVKGNADTIATFVEKEAARRGAKAGTSPAVAKAATAAAKAIPVTKADAKALQTALVAIGRTVGSAQLKAIKIDGAIGPKTVAGVNWAFTHHVGPGQAPAQFRTGNLGLGDVKANVGTLTALLNRETTRRGGSTSVAVAKRPAKRKKPTAAGSAKVRRKDGKVVEVEKVSTARGETYKVEDPETGQTYYTADPTVSPPPQAPAELPEPSAEQEAMAAEASAAAAASGQPTVVVPEQIMPGMMPTMMPEMGPSFFNEYKWPILGGLGALLVLGTGAMIMMRRPQGAAQYQPRLRARAR